MTRSASRTMSMIVGLTLVAVGLPVLVQPTAVAAPTARLTIGDRLIMADGAPAPAVGKAVIGANARWNDDELGAWDPETGRPAAGLSRAAKSAHLDTVRYPGGTVANLFDFKAAIGPQQDRGCQTSGGFARPTFEPLPAERNRFGPDEQQRFVRSFGGRTMIMVPSINKTARDAADYVEYMNSPADGRATNPNGGVDWAERRAANGHRAPYKIRTWEYGNEPYLAGQRYWRAVDLTERARDFVSGGWSHQTANSPGYTDNDGLFLGCDLATRQSGTGDPGQSYRTRYRPVALASDSTAASGPISDPVVTVGTEAWTRVDKLATAGPDARVFQVDSGSGTIRFGDGRHGAIPPRGARLSVDYTTGRQDGFLDYQRAMKAVDPTIQVCAGFAKSEFVQAMGSRPYDCLGVHSYTAPNGGDPADPYSTSELYDRLMVASGRPTDELADLRRMLAAQFPQRQARPDLIVSEYGTLNGASGSTAPLPQNFNAMLMHNVYTASLLVGQINNGVRLSINSNLNNPANPDPAKRDWGQLLASPPGFLVTGRAQALALTTALVGGAPRRIDVTDSAPVIRNGQRYDAFQAAGTVQGDHVALVIINRDPSQVRALTVQDSAQQGSARLMSVSGPRVTDFDTDQRTPVRSSTTRVDPSLRVRLAPHSVNLLTFDRKAQPGC